MGNIDLAMNAPDNHRARVEEIERAMLKESVETAMAQLQYEHDVLTGKLPPPPPQPFRIPFTIK